MKKESTARRPSRGFTLIELLVVAATIAILAAILFPVFAQTKLSAKTTSTAASLHQIGAAANLYANDYDLGVVQTCQGPGDSTSFWTVVLHPYLKSRESFFDPSRQTAITDKIRIGSALVNWTQVTTFAINDSGYTGIMPTTTGTCGGRIVPQSYRYGGRSLSTMVEPEKRIAFAPNSYHTDSTGWYFFHSYDASAYVPATVRGPSNYWNNQVYSTRANYAANAIPIVHADGSLGKLRAKDFVSKATTTTVDWCRWLNEGESAVWGRYWKAD